MRTDCLGKILNIDLDNAHITETNVLDNYQDYLGGMGLANLLAARYTDRVIDPFSSINPLIVTVGTLAGTPAPSSSRTSAMTLMPLNGAWGSANAGGGFAARLKWAGYEALVITGRSPKPVYLAIDNTAVKLLPADALWGKGILETTETLWRQHKDSSVIAIGPAGEKKITFALSLVDNMATLGRGGLGAVMGDKGLKAVVVKGTQLPKIVHKSKFLALAQDVHQRMRKLSWRNQWLRQGVYLGWSRWKEELSTENFSRRLPSEQIDRLSPQAYEKHIVRPLACISCPMADKATVKTGGAAKPISYGLQAALSGARWGAKDISQALDGMIEANDYGVDDLTLYAVVGWAIDMYQAGILSKEDTGGRALAHTAEEYGLLAREILERRGLGDLLAEGFMANKERFGEKGIELAVHIRGMDLISDPRPHSSGFLFSQLTNPRGPYVVQGNSPAFTPGKKPASLRRFLLSIGVSEDKAKIIAPDDGELDLALLVRHTEDWYAAVSSLGVCARQPVIQCYDPDSAARMVAAVLGIDFNGEDLLQVGERVWNQYRLNNGHQGQGQEILPDQLYQPLTVPGSEDYLLKNYEQDRKVTPQYVENSLQRYYAKRGWDNKGRVTSKNIERLQLSQ